MKTTHQKIDDLRAKFGNFGLSQSVGLQTNYRTTVIEELTDEELDRLYNMLLPSQNEAQKVYQLEQERELKRLRAIILKDATLLGIHDPQDWNKFNRFMKENSPLKKGLNEYSIEEFSKLQKQFKSMLQKFNERAKMPGTKEWYRKNNLPIPSMS